MDQIKTGNLRQTAIFLGVSYTTARNLQAKGLPIIKAGRRGVPAIIDLQEAKRWYTDFFLQDAAWQEEREKLMAQRAFITELTKRRTILYAEYIAREHGNQ